MLVIWKTYKYKVDNKFRYDFKEVSKNAQKIYFNSLYICILNIIGFELLHVLVDILKYIL
jgi:hypothetical protein